jgi:hypothetical protein
VESSSDDFRARFLSFAEWFVVALTAAGAAVLLRAILSPRHFTVQLVLVGAAVLVAIYSIFFLRASLRRLRTLRRLHEEGSTEQPQAYRH